MKRDTGGISMQRVDAAVVPVRASGLLFAFFRRMTPHARWGDVRRIADDIALQIHLAEMETRDRWHALQPRLLELEQRVARTGGNFDDALRRELHELHEELLHVRDAIYARARGDYVTGW